MKKFSDKIKSKGVNESFDPLNESKDDMKVEILYILDNLLKLQAHGSVDDRFLSGKVKIEGKELVADTILGLLDTMKCDFDLSALESLKKTSNDWKAIDEKIDSIKENKLEIKNKTNFNSLLEKYEGEGLVDYFKTNISKMRPSTLIGYSKLVESSNLDSDTKESIAKLIKSK